MSLTSSLFLNPFPNHPNVFPINAPFWSLPQTTHLIQTAVIPLGFPAFRAVFPSLTLKLHIVRGVSLFSPFDSDFWLLLERNSFYCLHVDHDHTQLFNEFLGITGIQKKKIYSKIPQIINRWSKWRLLLIPYFHPLKLVILIVFLRLIYLLFLIGVLILPVHFLMNKVLEAAMWNYDPFHFGRITTQRLTGLLILPKVIVFIE
jgi:hypothetical protein